MAFSQGFWLIEHAMNLTPYTGAFPTEQVPPASDITAITTGHQSPGTTRGRHIENAIKRAPLVSPWASLRLLRRQQVRDQAPLVVGTEDDGIKGGETMAPGSTTRGSSATAMATATEADATPAGIVSIGAACRRLSCTTEVITFRMRSRQTRYWCR